MPKRNISLKYQRDEEIIQTGAFIYISLFTKKVLSLYELVKEKENRNFFQPSLAAHKTSEQTFFYFTGKKQLVILHPSVLILF